MEAVEWARAHGADGDVELVQEYAWARVSRIGDLWLKECRPVQAFEVPLTIALASRWSDRLPTLVAAEKEHAWLLFGDAGTPLRAFGDSADAWLVAWPLYAELQAGEAAHADEHLAAGVPDRRPHTLPPRFEDWTEREPRLAPHASRFAEWCAALTLPASVQHDDLHDSNVFARDGRLVFLDWGDTTIAHPFSSLLVALRVLSNRHPPTALERMRDTYLEVWGGDAREEFAAAQRVGAFARLLTWERILELTGAEEAREGLTRNIEMLLEDLGDA